MVDHKKPGSRLAGDFGGGNAGEVVKRQSRRKFLSKTFLTTLGVIATGAVAKKVSDAVVKSSNCSSNDRALLAHGDRVMSRRHYRFMTEAEKDEFVKMFIDNYTYDKEA